jgi:hypothetical protein
VPTVAEVLNRQPRSRGERHYTATVIDRGPPSTVALDPGGARTQAIPLFDLVHVEGTRVLVLVTSFGNYVIGSI